MESNVAGKGAGEKAKDSASASKAKKLPEAHEEVEVPEGVEVQINGDEIKVTGPLGTNSRHFNTSLVSVSKDGKKLRIDSSKIKNLAKKSSYAVGSLAKELQNDINGVRSYFEIRMETVFMHFPVNLEAKNGIFTIKNLFGERKPRTAKIVGSTKVEIKDKNVRLYGTKLDDVSQTAANIRQACKIVNKDDRVFQDGVYYALE
ncbi:MAG: 50S ribosomal protein L6 [Candidatus Micrarchaeia archaeon]